MAGGAACGVALVLLVALAACGGGSGGGGGPVASTPTTPTTPTEPSTPTLPTTPIPEPAVGATACLNAALYATTGTVGVYRYQVQQGAVTRQVTHTATVVGAASSNGRAGTRIDIRETVQATGVTDVLFDGTLYVALADSKLQLLATETRFTQSGVAKTQTLTLNPSAPDLDFSLASGATSSTLSSVTVNLVPAATSSGTFNATTNVSFAGFDTVTVPAGTFTDACKFVQELVTSTRRTTTRWIARGSGVVVKSVTGTDTQSLVSGTIGGVAIAAQ